MDVIIRTKLLNLITYLNIFIDGCFPKLLQGSMDALNKLLAEPLPVNRFRPKYVFSQI